MSTVASYLFRDFNWILMLEALVNLHRLWLLFPSSLNGLHLAFLEVDLKCLHALFLVFLVMMADQWSLHLHLLETYHLDYTTTTLQVMVIITNVEMVHKLTHIIINLRHFPSILILTFYYYSLLVCFTDFVVIFRIYVIFGSNYVNYLHFIVWNSRW